MSTRATHVTEATLQKCKFKGQALVALFTSQPTSCSNIIQMKKGQDFMSWASLPVYVGTMTMQEQWLHTYTAT